MGSMRRKRRKKLARTWVDFQQQHGLTDELLKQARSLGPLQELLQEKLASAEFDESMSIADRISQLCRRRQEERLLRAAAIESGEIKVKPKKPKKKPAHDPQWAKAKQVCRLNMEDIRMAKELGISPKSLMKNVPAPGQLWKAPVKIWIRDQYEKRRQQSSKKSALRRDSRPTGVSSTEQPNHGDTHERIIEDWRQNAERNDDQNYEFLRSLKRRDYGFEPDELVGKLHQRAFAIVDCTRCANCCKTTQPQFNNEDIERIASHFQMEVDAFIKTYLQTGDGGSYVTRERPCPFLGKDDHCTIYEIRPTVCREYPYTNKQGLLHRTMSIANNAQTCPAVFWIVERMRQQARTQDTFEVND